VLHPQGDAGAMVTENRSAGTHLPYCCGADHGHYRCHRGAKQEGRGDEDVAFPEAVEHANLVNRLRHGERWSDQRVAGTDTPGCSNSSPIREEIVPAIASAKVFFLDPVPPISARPPGRTSNGYSVEGHERP
jgi:hypothetical protein